MCFFLAEKERFEFSFLRVTTYYYVLLSTQNPLQHIGFVLPSVTTCFRLRGKIRGRRGRIRGRNRGIKTALFSPWLSLHSFPPENKQIAPERKISPLTGICGRGTYPRDMHRGGVTFRYPPFLPGEGDIKKRRAAQNRSLVVYISIPTIA